MASDRELQARADKYRSRVLVKIRAALRGAGLPASDVDAVDEAMRALCECERVSGQAIALARAERKLGERVA